MNPQDFIKSITVKTLSNSATEGSFEISGLFPGYGLTLGNALRRTLLSSLPGGAITYIKIKGINHEFSSLEGIAEDIVAITLNIKKIRLATHSDEPQTLSLKAKGITTVTAGDIKKDSNVDIINPDQVIATLTAKNAELDMELTVEKGLGYSPAESRQDEKLSAGTIAVDALFSPVIKVNYEIKNIRVGDRTDYNQIDLSVVTDGSLKPSIALSEAGNILKEHFNIIVSSLNGAESVIADNSTDSKNKIADEDKSEK